MSKEKVCRVLEFRTASGELLFSLSIIEKQGATPEPPRSEQKPTKEKGGNGGKEEGKKEPGPGNNDAIMTDAQKRYLFRILAEGGFETEKAHEELKKSFGVDQTVIMKLTGHKTLSMFNRYKTVDQDDALEAMRKLDVVLIEQKARESSDIVQTGFSSQKNRDSEESLTN